MSRKTLATALAIGVLLASTALASAGTTKRSDAGTLNDGTKVKAITLASGSMFVFGRGRVLADRLRDGADPRIAIGRGYDDTFMTHHTSLVSAPQRSTRASPIATR